MGEIRLGEFAVIFLSDFVVSPGGFDFIAEAAEVVALVIAGFPGGSFSAFLCQYVFRAFVPAGADVPAVLGEGADTQVFLAVVQTVMVKVVHDQIDRGVRCILTLLPFSFRTA